MRAIFLDTSGIIAAMNRRDFYHSRAKEIFLELAAGHCRLIMTNYVRLETHALLLQRAGRSLALQFLEQDSWFVEWVNFEDEKRAIDLLRKFDDKNFTLTDATSFVIMKRLKINEVISFDRHFRQYGWKVLS